MSPVGLGEYYQAVVESTLITVFMWYYVILFIFSCSLCYQELKYASHPYFTLEDLMLVIVCGLALPIIAPFALIFVVFEAVISSIDLNRFVLWRRK